MFVYKQLFSTVFMYHKNGLTCNYKPNKEYHPYVSFLCIFHDNLIQYLHALKVLLNMEIVYMVFGRNCNMLKQKMLFKIISAHSTIYFLVFHNKIVFTFAKQCKYQIKMTVPSSSCWTSLSEEGNFDFPEKGKGSHPLPKLPLSYNSAPSKSINFSGLISCVDQLLKKQFFESSVSP